MLSFIAGFWSSTDEKQQSNKWEAVTWCMAGYPSLCNKSPPLQLAATIMNICHLAVLWVRCLGVLGSRVLWDCSKAVGRGCSVPLGGISLGRHLLLNSLMCLLAGLKPSPPASPQDCQILSSWILHGCVRQEGGRRQQHPQENSPLITKARRDVPLLPSH